MSNSSITRRRFAHLLGLGAACAVAKPHFTFAAVPVEGVASDVVRLSANENPYGPSQDALRAITDSFNVACRYPDRRNDDLIDALAKLNNVPNEQILLGDGSSEVLQLCALTFTGVKEGPCIVADPTFEALPNLAAANGAQVVKVPLTPSWSHDLAKMRAAAKGGLVYICNPNNPTASITPKDELRDFITKTPRETTILVDEAYFHFADSPDYESVIPLVKDHPSLIVSRTFSKIYGMAGLGCGYCVAQKETLERIRPHQMWDSVNIMALAAASASLDDPEQVPNGQRLNNDAKTFTIGELDKMGYKTIPSQANFIMFDCKRSVVPLIQALKQRNVEVGRLFPALPNYMRLTIGKRSEMESCLNAFKQVMA